MNKTVIGVAVAILLVAILGPIGVNLFVNNANTFSTTDSFVAVAGAGTPEVVTVRHPPVNPTPDQIILVEGVAVTPSAQNDTTGVYTIADADVAATNDITVQYQWAITNETVGTVFVLVVLFAVLGFALVFVQKIRTGKGR